MQPKPTLQTDLAESAPVQMHVEVTVSSPKKLAHNELVITLRLTKFIPE
jgi:hypothetical protein